MKKRCDHTKKSPDLMCMKDNTAMCEMCATCRHPKDYCKFRPSCLIWFMGHKKSDDEKKD